MARFGGNEFTDFSFPLIFEGRYFIMEPGDPPRITVVYNTDDTLIFEVLKNEPSLNPITEVSKTPVGVVTVSDKQTGRFLYKIRPDYETSVAFGKLDGTEISVRITDRIIQVDTNIIKDCVFTGNIAGIVVYPDGTFSMSTQIPQIVLQWLRSR